MDFEEKINLVKRNLAEIIGENELDNLLKEKRSLSVYWGTAPTGKPHVGYMLPALKIADLLKAGLKVKILIADLHAALDNTPWDILEYRYQYYSKVIPLLISSLGADISKLEFIRGSEFQLKKNYLLDLFKISSITSVKDCHKAASEVVKLGNSPKLSGYIYPLMQALDEEYLQVDMQLGGTDQRKIMVLAREKLPQIGYESRIELMNPLIPGLIGEKMSASIENSKIDLLDEPEIVLKKIKSAEFEEGNPNNGIMAFLKYVVFELKKDRGENFVIERSEKFGGNIILDSYDELEKLVLGKKIHPLDIKLACAREISNLISGIIEHKKEIEIISKKAYPN